MSQCVARGEVVEKWYKFEFLTFERTRTGKQKYFGVRNLLRKVFNYQIKDPHNTNKHYRQNISGKTKKNIRKNLFLLEHCGVTWIQHHHFELNCLHRLFTSASQESI